MMITITDPRILAFCETHVNFEPERVLLTFIETFDSLSRQDERSSIERTMMEMMKSVQESVVTNGERLSKELKQVVYDNVKDVSTTVLENIRGGNDNMKELLRVYLEIRDNRLEERLQHLSNVDLVAEVQKIKLLLEKDGLNVENIIHKVNDSNLSNVVDNIKNVVNPVLMKRLDDIHEQQVRFSQTVSMMKEDMMPMPGTLNTMSKSVLEYFERLKKPSVRGIQTENQVVQILERELPMHEISKVPSNQQKGQMDITIKRVGYPTILLDSKDYTSNVPQTQVEKFERDIIMSGNHGILLAPFSGIHDKRHFEISKINNRFAIYLHNTGLDVSDLKIALEVLYYLDKMTVVESENVVKIDAEVLTKLNQILNDHMGKIDAIKSQLRLILTQLDTSMIDTIKQMVGLTAEKKEEINECEKCGRAFSNKGALGNHRKHCKGNM